MRCLFLILAFLVPFAGTAYAETQPRQGPYDARVRLATYQDGQVYRIRVDRHARLTPILG